MFFRGILIFQKMNEFDIYTGLIVVLVVAVVSLFSWVTLLYICVLFLASLLLVKWFMGIPTYCHSTVRLDGKTVIITGIFCSVPYLPRMIWYPGNCPQISCTNLSDKMTYANSADICKQCRPRSDCSCVHKIQNLSKK